MVYIKRVELSHFKSFGGTTPIPLLPGFTVVSGPNGSGKSNILDALLFCLGLASSKGMRAERLPDLVNHNHGTHRNTTEASVSVTFDVSEAEENNGNGYHREWTVTRRLRVGKGGNYTSTYYINGELCTVSELHEQLNRFRIYPEGYNVVLQGDVTRIITMNSKERREIIDELAGVAEFDRKIEKTLKTLESVREREDRCHIIEQELTRSLLRLDTDRIKAEKYQKLKADIQNKQRKEVVLKWYLLKEQYQHLQTQITTGDTEAIQLQTQLTTINTQIQQTTTELEQFNTKVKALGEEEHLFLSSQLVTQQAQRQQLIQRQQELETLISTHHNDAERIQQEIKQYHQQLTQIISEKITIETEQLPILSQQHKHFKDTLVQNRIQAQTLAAASEAWVQEQTNLSRKINHLQEQLNPYRTEQAQLNERYQSLQITITEQTQRLKLTISEITNKTTEAENLSQDVNNFEQTFKELAQQLTIQEQLLTLQQDTQKRLQKEQRDKQRELDKLEATKQAQNEVQGTYATQIILQSDLPGVCGLVASLGEVKPQYQLALEIAAGARLGHVVVDDDSVASAGIALLKQKRAGRATFLPLNKIRSQRLQDISTLKYAKGFIDLAVNLVTYHSRYNAVFAYIFGSTVIFENIDDARRYLGDYRIVTLEGELLEMSGAMTGGSQPNRSTIHFGTTNPKESEEAEIFKRRLTEIEQILSRSDELILEKTSQVRKLTQEITELRQNGREKQLYFEQLQKDMHRLSLEKNELAKQLLQNEQALENAQLRLQILTLEIPDLEQKLQEEQEKLSKLEESKTHQEWQDIQNNLKLIEEKLQQKEHNLRAKESYLKDLENSDRRIKDKIRELEQNLNSLEKQKEKNLQQKINLQTDVNSFNNQIIETETLLEKLNETLGETKQQRNQIENILHSLQNQQQQLTWKQEKLIINQQERKEALETLQEQIKQNQNELPEVLENFSENESITVQIEKLQNDIRLGQKRLEAMEPVNMLALEEYEKTQERIEELKNKLTTLQGERTELLLRIENFTTLRFRAFKEAFDAVNENFKVIFATLSDGDGYLQLEDAEDPFNGGLNLVAHPKGKPVQRLSSMSGGEKSLTALSFIFSLQKYRPSPFYAFDEVDMFLDGANVEKLSKMIQKQAQQAQFIVVSLRRPMIEASQRTIGVTQARGAYTQVLGIKV
ncbi:chromosome segregation protein SMC [Aphanothece hegewaldii CCALA 016]|uniref:Chromosome partition protein Smc n=1 Tax=Aphanothece hegewaldii CCALA 016 TaxID=2107694 RepID=A0A2T1LY43_9CHRO|nr:chromosome segregation protein SMC [Aphanothece hegewaldii]PSF37303.1 chromosome segregation protein SMC [Aphanothece hegewaldii CCALA 016]